MINLNAKEKEYLVGLIEENLAQLGAYTASYKEVKDDVNILEGILKKLKEEK